MTNAQSDWQARVARATDLEDLLDILRSAECHLNEIRQNTEWQDCGGGVEQVLGIDITDLPTFGGEEPQEDDVWSWDAERVLTGEGNINEWTIEARC